MTRSRRRRLRREGKPAPRKAWKLSPLASALLACMHPAHAADDQPTPAYSRKSWSPRRKRAENLQDVPLSIQAFGTTRLEELNYRDFDDYAKFLPSVSFQKVGGPGFEHIYMRGVSSGGDGNHSGSLPTVGMYLDEQPVTTIDGMLDIHIYDIARVEALAGPQGTLYGASSEAGHDPHHHQQARSERVLRRLRPRRQQGRPWRPRAISRGFRQSSLESDCSHSPRRLG